MKPHMRADHTTTGGVPLIDGKDAIDHEVPLRRANARNDACASVGPPIMVESMGDFASLDDAAKPSDVPRAGPPLLLSIFMLMQRAMRHICPAQLHFRLSALMKAVADIFERCCGGEWRLAIRPAGLKQCTGCLSMANAIRTAVMGFCVIVGRMLACGTNFLCRRKGAQREADAAARSRRRCHPVFNCVCRYVVLSLLCIAVVAFAAAAFLMFVVYLSVMTDPCAKERIQLSAVYSRGLVDEVLVDIRARDPVYRLLPKPQLHPLFRYKMLRVIRDEFEEKLIHWLAASWAQHQANAKEASVALMTHFLSLLKPPVRVMMGEFPSARNAPRFSELPFSIDPRGGKTVGERTIGVVRSAIRRCIYGVPTLPAPTTPEGGPNAPPRDAIFDALWSAFAKANAVANVQPQCLARSQRRLPCADVGVGHDAAELPSRVQHLYEHGRLPVDSDAVAQLYYASTPALPAEARAWGLAPLSSSSATTSDAVLERVSMQQERFRRSAPTSAGGGAARPLSAVIMFLSGAADRNPEGRKAVFMQHALPLLERHLLQRYPHYPVYVFYEAPALASHPVPAWTLRDVLRHSDVYTVLHRWRGPMGTQAGSGGQPVHVAPPPPVLVDRVELLPTMRAQQAALQEWFGAVALRVPSAPYVTFENVAPLFSTLPCGVSEEDVDHWLLDKRYQPEHRRGYRQMCRFWARLVWRLPSLRMRTDSQEGREALAVYGEDGRAAEGGADVLPPWRYRYSYYMRLDTDSYIHRPMACDPFVTLAARRCAYGYNSMVADSKRAIMHLGTAMAEWIESRTSMPKKKRGSQKAESAARTQLVFGEWGRLIDPSLSSTVTLVAAGDNATSLLPPLPPTWPWHGVYPEHSSTALSAAEKDVLRTLFFTDEVEAWLAHRGNAPLLGERNASRDKMLADRLPPHYAQRRTYSRVMYFNNFEMGTFALKNHPLYTSATEFFDNRDYDDVTGQEREAAGTEYSLRLLNVQDTPHVSAPLPVRNTARVHESEVYLLVGPAELPHAATTTKLRAAPRGEPQEQCRDRDGGRGRLRMGNNSFKIAASGDKEWRSGYLQYRWGDAPVHSFGVEAVMQREGWSVCAFTEDLGWYEHGDYIPR